MALKKAWAKLIDGTKAFSIAHVQSVFYNYASNILLKDKLDEMDALIDEKIAKAMMSGQQVNDANKVPTSALLYAMKQDIDETFTQQNENIELRTIKNVSLIFTSTTVSATSNELGGYYALLDLDKVSNITFPDGLKAILPLGCLRTDDPGYVGVVAPYSWRTVYLVTKQWAIVAPTAGTYGVVFACLY